MIDLCPRLFDEIKLTQAMNYDKLQETQGDYNTGLGLVLRPKLAEYNNCIFLRFQVSFGGKKAQGKASEVAWQLEVESATVSLSFFATGMNINKLGTKDI